LCIRKGTFNLLSTLTNRLKLSDKAGVRWETQPQAMSKSPQYRYLQMTPLAC
jgi:hypothetical protein